MPEKRTLKRAQEDKKQGKAASTQAGEFVREEMDHIRAGKHGARSAKQAIAIGLSKARRAGVDLPAPKEGTTSEATRKKAAQDSRKGHAHKTTKPSAKRSAATTEALKREPRSAASHRALSRQAKQSAAKRSATKKSTAKESTAKKRK
jgi:hypothetical protein